MAKRQPVDLYEVLAQRKLREPKAERATDPEKPVPEQRVTKARSDRDLVIGMDTAFVLFVGVLAVIGSAYMLGHQRGAAEQRQRLFARPDKEGAIVSLPADDLGVVRAEGRGRQVEVRFPAGKYTLRLRTTKRRNTAEMERLLRDRDYLLASPVVHDKEMDVFIFDNGEVYSLGLGVFDEGDAQLLKELQRGFRAASGPPTSTVDRPYQACAPARGEDLGEVAPL